MIDEAVLERLLRDEAATYEPPEHGPDAVLAAAAEQTEGRRDRGRWLAVAAAAVLVTGGVVVARGAGGPGAAPMAGRASSGANGLSEATSETVGDYDDSGAKPMSGVGGGAVAPTDPSVVRTGGTWLVVPDGKVADTLRAAARVAGAHGGFVSESQAQTAGDDPSGLVTLKVPVAAYDRAVEDVGRLGEVQQSETQSEDVSAQVTDAAARLKSLAATRDQLRTLLSRATDVGDVLAVQERITDVQTQIEQLQGKQDALREQTTYGTLRVSVSGPGGAEPADGFGKAWDDAVDGFVGGFEALVAASGTVLFVLIVGLVLLVAGRRAYRYWVRGVV